MQCKNWTVLSAHSHSSYKTYRYAVLWTPCCFLQFNSTHSPVTPVPTILHSTVTQNSPRIFNYLCYNCVTICYTTVQQLQLTAKQNVTYFHLLIPLHTEAILFQHQHSPLLMKPSLKLPDLLKTSVATIVIEYRQVQTEFDRKFTGSTGTGIYSRPQQLLAMWHLDTKNMWGREPTSMA